MIGRELARFLEEGLAVQIGTRDADLRPHGARAVAARVEPDGVHFVVYLAEVAAARILADLESNGRAAVVFCRPYDDRACQVKGTFVAVRPAGESERRFVERRWNAFLDQLEQIGIPRAATTGWVTWPAVAIRLRVTAVFDQTPGPHAGAALA
jgi:hypothetical protein